MAAVGVLALGCAYSMASGHFPGHTQHPAHRHGQLQAGPSAVGLLQFEGPAVQAEHLPGRRELHAVCETTQSYTQQSPRLTQFICTV